MSGSVSGAPIRLLVVDDHPLFRRGLVALLASNPRFVIVGEAADAGEAQRLALALQPDLILLDNHLPGASGIDAIADLRRAAPATRVLMLTVSEEEQDLARALQRGASGYLLKTVDTDVLIGAIERTVRGESALSPELTGKLMSAFRAVHAPAPPEPPPAVPDRIDTLSPREREILAAISRGASNKEIARDLDIAETTVKIHVQHILRKLDLSSRVQAAVYAADRRVRD